MGRSLTGADEILDIAGEIIRSAENSVIMNLRFLGVAMAAIRWEPRIGSTMIACNGSVCYYDPALIIRRFRNEPAGIIRCYLHVLFHFIFHHNYEYARKREDIWDMACDIAVENIIMELMVPAFTLVDDSDRAFILKGLSKEVRSLTAEHIYKYFLVNPPAKVDRFKFAGIFGQDLHYYWRKAIQQR